MSKNNLTSIDVAIIGSGFAGLSAAMEAANSGAKKVFIFEKMDKAGGNSTRTRARLLLWVLLIKIGLALKIASS